MRRYDLQVHTHVSPCASARADSIIAAAQDAALDGIAITDHDSLAGYDEVASLAPSALDVIPGAEVTTSDGHILALDIDTLPPSTRPRTVVDQIHNQGGIAILSHPFDRFREHFQSISPELARRIDGLEATNSRCLLPRFNRAARVFAEKNSLSGTGGSDAHFPWEIGRAVTVSPGAILPAIRGGRVEYQGRGGYISGHIATKLTQLSPI